MFSSITINSEEFIFYIDLTKDFIKKKNLIKSILSFAKEREKLNSISSYGLLMFQQEENLLYSYDRKDSDTIIEILNDKWDERELNNSFLENGLFELLAYIFKKSQEERKNYRIIIISDTPSGLSEVYHHTLYDLLLKAKNFNTFIDIIRIGDEKFYPDDVKLKVITSETGGGVFYCNDPKLFPNILNSLMQSKTEFSLIRCDGDEKILEQDKLFYERLAVDLISLDTDEKEVCDICKQELCPICEAHSDEVHKCFNCDAKYHACCATKYALRNNIGIKHLFRCVKCDTLLKLDEDYVELIYMEELEELEETQEILSENEELEEFTADNEDLNEVNAGTETGGEKKYTQSKVRIGGFFGQEIEISKLKNGNKIKEAPKDLDSESVAVKKETISITSLNPPKKKTIKLCKICGATLRNTNACPKCGFNN
ncbi:MAG: VWA domain-containing protein [Promethearchaeota archaeon]|nr:MAG: VWA domain-containing protein [Candidatus Lokiarchaeota archaeon]